MQVRHSCFPGQDWAHLSGKRPRCGRVIPIEKEAWTDERIVARGMFGDGGTVRGMHQWNGEAMLSQNFQALLKSSQLRLGMLTVFIVGIGQMRHDAFQMQRCAKHRTADEVWQFNAGKAKAAHTGIDLDMHAVGANSAGHFVREGLYHISSKQDRCQSMSHQIGELRRDRRAHHHDVIMNAGLAECETFIDGGDSETADGKPLEGAGHFNGAVTIGVGLDDGQHL